jgi:hypothetical protein
MAMTECDEVFDRILNRIDHAIKNLETGSHRFKTQHDLQMELSRIQGMIDALRDSGKFPHEYTDEIHMIGTDAYRSALSRIENRDAQKVAVTSYSTQLPQGS